jgi:hypothetical protein
MAVVDEQGRLFGRFNVFDAIVAVLVLWLIPIAYGGYLLFRAPSPTLISAEPSTVVHAPEMKFRVRGTHFAPYLRVSAGRYQGRTFKFNDTTDADVDLVNVPPGVYDLILYDNSQERSRIPNGLTIVASTLPEAKLTAVGRFGNLTPAQADTIKPGMQIQGIGVVEQVGKLTPQLQHVFVRPANVEVPIASAQMLPAVVRMSCFVRSAQGQPECVSGGVSMQPATLLELDMPFGKVPFQIDQVRSIAPLVPVRVTVRFSGEPRALAPMKAGDADFGDIRNELSATARIDSLDPPAGGSREVRLTVQAQRGADGWLYGNLPLRLGSPYTLRNDRYEARGTVVAVDAPAAESGK